MDILYGRRYIVKLIGMLVGGESACIGRCHCFLGGSSGSVLNNDFKIIAYGCSVKRIYAVKVKQYGSRFLLRAQCKDSAVAAELPSVIADVICFFSFAKINPFVSWIFNFKILVEPDGY